ncbi:hypothetical protein WME94_20025 [Sorangium sp. So ce429]
MPIGLLSNGHEIRLVYPPHGESSGWLAFRVADTASVSRRPSFDAFVMLLERQRWFGVAIEQTLPAILAESRNRNAGLTNVGVLSTAAPRCGELSGRRCRPAPDLTTGGAETCGSCWPSTPGGRRTRRRVRAAPSGRA